MVGNPRIDVLYTRRDCDPILIHLSKSVPRDVNIYASTFNSQADILGVRAESIYARPRKENRDSRLFNCFLPPKWVVTPFKSDTEG